MTPSPCKLRRYRPFISSGLLLLGLFFFLGAQVRADDIMFAYEADALPVDSGWEVFDPCAPPCSEQIVDGKLVLEWPAAFGDIVNYNRFVSIAPDTPPSTFWVEFRFKSILERPIIGFGCDASVSVGYFLQPETVFLHGDGAGDPGGQGFMFGLPVDTFRTFRFESEDGATFAYFIDGAFLFEETSLTPVADSPNVQFRGLGSCTAAQVERNTWDYVRFGTIARGETIVSSDPPSGVLSELQFPSLDRFIVTFDAPNYATIAEISVAVTGGPVTTILQTRRNDNFATDTVEIVLDQPLTVGETTTFTFDDGVAVNVVAYTIEPDGICCGSGGSCEAGTPSTCNEPGDVFVDATCQTPSACCLSDGSCRVLDPTCCVAFGGTSLVALACEGDSDNDGIDGRCGDECPNDSDNDVDDDGICGDVDDCPLLNPNDANNNGTPDCLEDPVIPTVSGWGLLVLTIVLLVLAKVRFGGRARARTE